MAVHDAGIAIRPGDRCEITVSRDNVTRDGEDRWTLRLDNSGWSEKTCLWFVTEIGAAGLKITGNTVRCIPNRETDAREIAIPQTDLLQLALGYRTVSDAANDRGVRIPRTAGPLLEVLLPPSPAMMPMVAE